MRGNYIGGLILVLIGIIFLLVNLGVIHVDIVNAWPILVIAVGLLFEISFFINRRDPGVLVPAGIFITSGILFLMNTYFGWHLMATLWPVFPLGVAIGLLQLYLFGTRETALLIPVFILGGFSIVALNFTLNYIDTGLIIPGILILAGLALILKRK